MYQTKKTGITVPAYAAGHFMKALKLTARNNFTKVSLFCTILQFNHHELWVFASICFQDYAPH